VVKLAPLFVGDEFSCSSASPGRIQRAVMYVIRPYKHGLTRSAAIVAVTPSPSHEVDALPVVSGWLEIS